MNKITPMAPKSTPAAPPRPRGRPKKTGPTRTSSAIDSQAGGFTDEPVVEHDSDIVGPISRPSC